MWLNNNSIFENKQLKIPEESEVVFVSDLFVEDYGGGAEKTIDALCAASPLNIFKLHSKDVSMDLLEKGHQKYWIFGNFSQLDPKLIPSIVRNLKYSIVEMDYKFCRYRLPQLHKENEKVECNCAESAWGKLISTFFHGAKSLWWMSEEQQNYYFEKFPFLQENNNTVLSSVFDDQFFLKVKILREKNKNKERKGWVYLKSPSWVKGTENVEKYVEENNLEAEGLWGLEEDEVLNKLASAEGYISLPNGFDTCPRMNIMAKLLNCKIVDNEFVQHRNEEWFTSDDLLTTESYLHASRTFFWNGIKSDMSYRPTLSSYYYLKNAISQHYPWKQSINSVLPVSDQVVVLVAVDKEGNDDGTLKEVEKWAEQEQKLKVAHTKVDWNHPRFGRFDGELKAMAREMCDGDFCLQMDSDELLHEDDIDKWKNLIYDFPRNFDLIALPVVEFWGDKGKFRMDVNPWKIRLSRGNKTAPYITHGIPKHLRAHDEDGELYCVGGDDGCSYIHKETKDMLMNYGSFYTNDVEGVRRSGVEGNEKHREMYEKWLNNVVGTYPTIWHYSWKDLPRKIRTYRGYWTRHWSSLYNQNVEDTAETNMFFDKPWIEVSEEEIVELAERLEKETGGHIWHSKIDFSNPTPHIKINKEEPEYYAKLD